MVTQGSVGLQVAADWFRPCFRFFLWFALVTKMTKVGRTLPAFRYRQARDRMTSRGHSKGSAAVVWLRVWKCATVLLIGRSESTGYGSFVEGEQ